MKSVNKIIIGCLIPLCCAVFFKGCTSENSASETVQQLRVSENNRFFVKEDGSPFFYLGDTAWGLFSRTTREEAVEYLEDRKAKGFTVIQAVIVLWDGTRSPNAYGELPLIEGDPEQPNEAYFEHVDFIMEKAESMGLYMSILPVWVKGFIQQDEDSPLLDSDKMRSFSRFLGARYKDAPLVWVLGGDWPGEELRDLSEAMAAGLEEGDRGNHLITYHPTGRQSSSWWFHDAEWLDFNFIQSGHFIHNTNYEIVSEDYGKEPVKPTMDSEPGYENITDRLIRNDPDAVRIGAWDVRRYGYLGVFAGGAGHAYGCGEVYEFWEPGNGGLPGWAAELPWRQSMQLPGAGQMKHLRTLIESRPMLIRVPDQTLIVGEHFKTTERIQATRGEDGSYAFVYTASGKPVQINLDRLSGQRIDAYWYNPRTGNSRPIGNYERSGTRQFTPPSTGENQDWVLGLDDADMGYPLPGKVY